MLTIDLTYEDDQKPEITESKKHCFHGEEHNLLENYFKSFGKIEVHDPKKPRKKKPNDDSKPEVF
jgi:hypothetical protein